MQSTAPTGSGDMESTEKDAREQNLWRVPGKGIGIDCRTSGCPCPDLRVPSSSDLSHLLRH